MNPRPQRNGPSHHLTHQALTLSKLNVAGLYMYKNFQCTVHVDLISFYNLFLDLSAHINMLFQHILPNFDPFYHKFDFFSGGEEKYRYSGKHDKDSLVEWMRK